MTNTEIEDIARVIGVDEDQVASRHRAVQDALRWFAYDHLPIGRPRDVSVHCAALAGDMLQFIPFDDPELTRGLSRLLEAKDCLVRAAIAAGKARGE